MEINNTKATESLRIPVPEGLFDEYYNRAFEPEDIAYEIEELRIADAQAAELRDNLYNYRFYTRKEAGKSIVSDRFMAFWVNLRYFDKSSGKMKFRLRVAKKSLAGELENKQISGIFGDNIDIRALYEQLYSSARRYLSTCQTDRTYTSVMFGFSALKRPQLIEKLLADFIDALCFAERCGLLLDFPVVGKAAVHAWLDEFPETDGMIIKRIYAVLGEQAGAEMLERLKAD